MVQQTNEEKKERRTADKQMCKRPRHHYSSHEREECVVQCEPRSSGNYEPIVRLLVDRQSDCLSVYESPENAQVNTACIRVHDAVCCLVVLDVMAVVDTCPSSVLSSLILAQRELKLMFVCNIVVLDATRVGL